VVSIGPDIGGFSEEQVEEVWLVVRLLPVFCTTILYWTVYAQMGTFFIIQGTQMDRCVFGSRFCVPSASLAVFNILSIIILIPLYDKGLLPLLRAYNRQLSLLQRIGEKYLIEFCC
jgi:solute carrier family 15 (peptide/histidine transporter), member 3/4